MKITIAKDGIREESLGPALEKADSVVKFEPRGVLSVWIEDLRAALEQLRKGE